MKRMGKILALFFLIATITLGVVESVGVTGENSANQNNDLVEVYRDNSTVILLDKNLDKNRTQWLPTLFSRGWKFVRENYGSFGGGREEGRLVGEVRANRKSGRSYRSSSLTKNRDVNKITIEIESDNPTSGGFYDDPSVVSKVKSPKDKILIIDMLQQIADLVLSGNGRVSGGITDNIVEPGVWRDIFLYDTLTQLGYPKEAQDWKKRQVNRVVKVKCVKGQVFWMRDWILPLYEKYGRTQFLAKLFLLAGAYWSKEYFINVEGASFIYDEPMEVGGYLHFISGAAGKDLRSMAKTVLGWNQTNDQEFAMARLLYPQVKY